MDENVIWWKRYRCTGLIKNIWFTSKFLIKRCDVIFVELETIIRLREESLRRFRYRSKCFLSIATTWHEAWSKAKRSNSSSRTDVNRRDIFHRGMQPGVSYLMRMRTRLKTVTSHTIWLISIRYYYSFSNFHECPQFNHRNGDLKSYCYYLFFTVQVSSIKYIIKLLNRWTRLSNGFYLQEA